jgi:hypothetical protein
MNTFNFIHSHFLHFDFLFQNWCQKRPGTTGFSVYVTEIYKLIQFFPIVPTAARSS